MGKQLAADIYIQAALSKGAAFLHERQREVALDIADHSAELARLSIERHYLSAVISTFEAPHD